MNYFTSEQYKNCKIQFDEHGLILSVSLNITKDMKKHLYKKHVFEGEKRIVYVLRKRVKNPTARNMATAYEQLINKLKINCRLAKINVLNSEIIKINS